MGALRLEVLPLVPHLGAEELPFGQEENKDGCRWHGLEVEGGFWKRGPGASDWPSA